MRSRPLKVECVQSEYVGTIPDCKACVLIPSLFCPFLGVMVWIFICRERTLALAKWSNRVNPGSPHTRHLQRFDWI